MARAKPEGSETIPQITFTEKEVQSVADFVNYVYKNASFTHKMDDSLKLVRMLNAMQSHIKKMEDHIFDPSTFTVQESKKG